jgi:hypothetical protein
VLGDFLQIIRKHGGVCVGEITMINFQEVEFTNSVGMPDYSLIRSDIKALASNKGLLSALPLEWCIWSAIARDKGKPAKKPFGKHGGLDSGKSDGWLTFAEAVALFEAGGSDGIGVRMGSHTNNGKSDGMGLDTINGKLCGLDLDNVIGDDGGIKPDKADIYADFMSIGGYIELSPSGTGLRQFVIASRPEGYVENNGSGLEIYDNGSKRYLTLTGITWPIGTAPGEVIEAQEAVNAFTAAWGKPIAAPGKVDAEVVAGHGRTPDEVMALLRQRNKRGKITKLLAGDTSDYPGHSEADMALCAEAAYYTRDPSVIDAVIRQTGLYRSKWDDKRGKITYGLQTIEKSLESQRGFFDTDQEAKAATTAAAATEKAKTAAKAEKVLFGGFIDLQTAKGAWRTDTYSLTQILFRDSRLAGICNYDDFSGMVVFNAPLSLALSDKAAPDTVGRLEAEHVNAIERWLGREWGLVFSHPAAVKKIVVGWARYNRINPLTDRLNELAAGWDGIKRLDNWLLTYCNAEIAGANKVNIGDYIRAVGAKWILSAVSRAFKPGSKVDTMLILEGAQGTRKSSAVRALAEALGSEYFREGFSLTGSAHTDAQRSLRGRLVIEWGEMAGLGKRDHNEMKNFISLQTDTYRDLYEPIDTDWPRTAIFCGTTNDSEYLADPTGNRRFWPVQVGKIDLARLIQDAPMLWAEAVVRFKEGERWWFDDSDPTDQRLLALAAGEQIHRVGTTIYSEAAYALAARLVNAGIDYGKGELATASFNRVEICAWLRKIDVEVDPNDQKLWTTVTLGFKHAGWVKLKTGGLSKWKIGPDLLAKLQPAKSLHGGVRSKKTALRYEGPEPGPRA